MSRSQRDSWHNRPCGKRLRPGEPGQEQTLLDLGTGAGETEGDDDGDDDDDDDSNSCYYCVPGTMLSLSVSFHVVFTKHSLV